MTRNTWRGQTGLGFEDSGGAWGFVHSGPNTSIRFLPEALDSLDLCLPSKEGTQVQIAGAYGP